DEERQRRILTLEYLQAVHDLRLGERYPTRTASSSARPDAAGRHEDQVMKHSFVVPESLACGNALEPDGDGRAEITALAVVGQGKVGHHRFLLQSRTRFGCIRFRDNQFAFLELLATLTSLQKEPLFFS